MKIKSSETNDYLGRSGKGLITSLGLKDIIKPNNLKGKFAIAEVSIKNISKIIRKFKDINCEGYVKKRSKHMPTDRYLYLVRQIVNSMMSTQKISNLRGLVITQKMSTQKMSNFCVYSTD